MFLLVLSFFLLGPRTDAPGIRNPQLPKPVVQQTQTFNKKLYSNVEPGSIWWIVNKKRLLPAGYAPAELVVPSVPLRLAASAEQMHVSQQIVTPIQELFAGAKQAGFVLQIDSGYRSYAYQQQLYGSYAAKDGQAAADTYSARPGASEHQTGLALDVAATDNKCQLSQCFGQTPVGLWLAAHAHEYGFVIRYLQGKEAITGYQYEPWHLRYVGKDLAAELSKSSQTMEEFFGVQ